MVVSDLTFIMNVAQQRNMRNWSPLERPSKTFSVSHTTTGYWDPCAVRHSVETLVRRHEGLRSQIAGTTASGLVQQRVLSAEEAIKRLEWVTKPAADRHAIAAVVRSTRARQVDPEACALAVTVWASDRGVQAVQLSVSHVFADGFAQQILWDELKALLAGSELTDLPGQASGYADDALSKEVHENGRYWRKVLQDAPRACTYSAAERAESEMVDVAEIALSVDATRNIDSACDALRITPYVLWLTAMSSLVSRLVHVDYQVFRTTTANRYDEQDLSVVTQLATAVYSPIMGGPSDSLASRAEAIFDSTLASYDRGMFDVNQLLTELNSTDLRRGAIFQPAFEINYVDSNAVGDPDDTVREVLTAWREEFRIDPPAGKADLALSVWRVPGLISVRLLGRRPVHLRRSVSSLLLDLLEVVRLISTNPSMTVDLIPVAPLPGQSELWRRHHSGVAVDLHAERQLLLGIPGVQSCDLSINDDEGRLRAAVSVDEWIPAAHLESACVDRQPWRSGTVVPDEIVIRRASE